MEQKIRATLFYLSVITFFICLPVVLLYSFGYKLDISKFRFARTGLIYLKTAPDGARVYLNGRDLKKTTPISIQELLPGKYKIALELESYNPWFQIVGVSSGRTTYLDKIVLFAKRPYLNKINILDVDDFYLFFHDKDYIYCLSDERDNLYKAKVNTKEQEISLVCDHLDIPENSKDFSLSPDKKKIFYIFENRLNVVYLPAEKLNYQQTKNSNFSISANERILYAFWFSDSEHIITVTKKDISVYELLSQGKNNRITLLNLRDNHPKAFYDGEEDILYFTDIQEGADSKWHRGLYRLDVGKKSLLSFIKTIEGNIK